MDDNTVIADVRQAKAWLDQQSGTMGEHVERLKRIERAYCDRSGEFEGIAAAPIAALRAIIDAAAEEPGRELLNEIRPGKAG